MNIGGFWNDVIGGMNDWKITYQGTDKANKKALTNMANQGEGFDVIAPTSYRTGYAKQNRDKIGRFLSGFQYSDVNIADSMEKPDDGKKLFSVASTAIEGARYEPSDDSLNITYKGNNDKEYKFLAGGAEGVKEWINAPSKGRITQEWRKTHRYPGY